MGAGPSSRHRASPISSAAGAGRFFHNSIPPSKQNRLGKPPEQSFARSQLARDIDGYMLLVSYTAS